MGNENFTPRNDVNVDYHQESGTWGVRLFAKDMPWLKMGQFVSWGAKSPMDCKNLAYYHYPLGEESDSNQI